MKGFLKAIGLVLALIAVGVASSLAVIAILLKQQEVHVPEVAGRDIVTAIEILSQQGLQVKVERREPHPSIPRDTVISQDPLPGGSLKKGRAVRIVVSLGPSDLQAPDLAGQHFRKAEMELRRLGFYVGSVSRVYSDETVRDTVIAQDPAPGSPLEKGGVINLLVSAGRRPEVLIMPKLTGRKAEEAVRILERFGLQYRVAYKAGGKPEASRTVTGQRPGYGSPVRADSIVELTVSR